MIPTRIELDTQARRLTIDFDTGETFEYTCEFLRVHSQSAEVVGHRPEDYQLQVGKEDVGCEAITPVGNYGIRIHFDDGHDTGIYTWERLYELGKHYGHYWTEYLKRLRTVPESARVAGAMAGSFKARAAAFGGAKGKASNTEDDAIPPQPGGTG